MKRIILLLLLAQTVFSQEKGLRFGKIDTFTASLFIDAVASVNEGGLDFGSEIEWHSFMFVKCGFESFSILEGGYSDFHWSIGPNFVSGKEERWRYFAGVRNAIVFRDGGQAWNYGLEAGIDFNITKHFFVGLRYTMDHRSDQEIIMHWKAQNLSSGFVRFGYKFYYKNKKVKWGN